MASKQLKRQQLLVTYVWTPRQTDLRDIFRTVLTFDKRERKTAKELLSRRKLTCSSSVESLHHTGEVDFADDSMAFGMTIMLERSRISLERKVEQKNTVDYSSYLDEAS